MNHPHPTNMNTQERQHARNQLHYTQQMNSCEWEPGQDAYWYGEGYSVGTRWYAGKPLPEVEYAITHYEPKSRWECGSYERGIYHSLVDMYAIRTGTLNV